MERLGEDELSSIFERIPDSKDKKSFAKVCKKFLKVACFRLRRVYNKFPDLLYDILVASPRLVDFQCEEPLSNNHMKLIAESCPNLGRLFLSIEQYFNQEVGKSLDFDDIGLCVIADACNYLVHVDLRGRLGFKEIGIGSLVKSCKNLRLLDLEGCVNVTDKSLKVIAEATCLEELFLGGCCLISDMGLEFLANGDLKYCLDKLILRKCDRITDKGIIHLKKLVSLRNLDLSNCGANITDYGVVALCELPNIEILNLDFLLNITDISLLDIARKCLNLWKISLNGCNRITNVGLRAFSGHQCLTRIELFTCYKFSWEDVKSTALTCPRLEVLHLSRKIKKPMPNLGYEAFFINGIRHYWIQWK